MRWFGPNDPVGLGTIKQAGCSGVVTALHHIPVGDIWPVEEITERQQIIAQYGLKWEVVESLPVHDSIKKNLPESEYLISNYIRSLENLSKCDIKVVTYNFMPVLDWLRTDVNYPLNDGSSALYFSKYGLIAFDLFILKRPEAHRQYSDSEYSKAAAFFETLDNKARESLCQNILLGLPGSTENFTLENLRKEIDSYKNIDAQALKKNLIRFLTLVAPAAQEFGVNLAIHPDDPPFPVLGLPRVVSTGEDLSEIFKAVDVPANGLCFCTGSLGAHPENKPEEIFEQFKERIYFLHLRNIIRTDSGDFFESNHLDGDVPMPQIVEKILIWMKETRIPLPMRPDHGHLMLDDLNKKYYPGYSAIGRLKGLAELRGLEIGINLNGKR